MTRRQNLWAAAAAYALLAASPAYADNYVAKDGNGNIFSLAGKLFSGALHPFHIMEGLISGSGNPQPVSVDGSGNVNVNVVSGGGGGGGGGPITAASGSYSSGALALGAIVDLGTGSSPGANTTNGYLKSLTTSLPPFGSPPTFNLGTSALIGTASSTTCTSGTLTLMGCAYVTAQSAAGPIPGQSGTGVDIGAVEAKSLTTGGGTQYHSITTASTNATLVSTGAHTLYALIPVGLNATVGYVRLYDTASSPTCSSATGAGWVLPVIAASGSEGGVSIQLPPQGLAFANGLAFCVTGGPTDTDATSAPAGIIINALYK